jgi:hypothetical protein
MKNHSSALQKLKVAFLVILMGMAVSACKKKDDCKIVCQNGGVVNENCACDCPAGYTGTYCEIRVGQTIEVQGNITSSTTWTSNNTYILKGFVYVKEPAMLTIEAGTLIKGDKNTKGTLIVERGAKIMAVGTASKPIVFTSAQPSGQRDYGDWGGIIICGRAPVNLPGGEGIIEGGVGSSFGGNNPDDNSGKLRYVRIEFSGIAFQPNNEINGLTLGGVGAGTEIEYIQVSYNGDDSFEMFGGTVNLKHIVSFRAWDDDFDIDNGYSGKVQFGVALRDPNIADQSGSNGFESDNDGQGTSATPYTTAIFSNISIFGPLVESNTTINPQFRRAAHLRRNTRMKIYNSILAGFPTGLLIDGSLCETNATNNDIQFRNNIISGCTTPLAVNSGSSFDITSWFNSSGWGNTLLTSNSDLQIPNAFNLSAPNFLPASGSPVLSGASFSNPHLAGFVQVNYRGAFGTTDWTQGWCNWDPQNTNY